MALLRLILIAFLIYYILKFIGRLLFPWFFITENKNRNFKEPGSAGKIRKEGEVSVHDVQGDRDKIIQKDKGEYIDYEEIK